MKKLKIELQPHRSIHRRPDNAEIHLANIDKIVADFDRMIARTEKLYLRKSESRVRKALGKSLLKILKDQRNRWFLMVTEWRAFRHNPAFRSTWEIKKSAIPNFLNNA